MDSTSVKNHRLNIAKLLAISSATLSSAGGFVADFLYPVAPYGLYIAIIISFILVISLAIRFFPPINNMLSNKLEDYWYFPTFIFLLIGIFIFSGGYFLSSNNNANNQNGYLASVFPEIIELQNTLLNIEQDISQIKENTGRTAEATERTANAVEKTAVISESLKKEVSDNPRKELANLGIPWTIENFKNAVATSDIQAIELFIDGGMKPSFDIFILSISARYTPMLENVFAEKNFIPDDRFCPTEYRWLDYYAAATGHKNISNYIKSTCGTKNIISSIEKEYLTIKNELDLKINENTSYNKNLNKNISSCIGNLSNTSYETYSDQATNSYPELMQKSTFTERESLLIKVYFGILSMSTELRQNPNKWLLNEIKNTCKEHYSPKETNLTDERLKIYEESLKVLKG